MADVPRPLLIAESPSRTSDPERPLSGRSGDRLRALLGAELEDVFAVANLLDSWPGRDAGGGSKLPPADARAAAVAILARCRRDRIVFVGSRVARAFGVPAPVLEPCRWYDARLFAPFNGRRWPAAVALLPHPSGLCRFWNEPANVELARRFLRSVE
jgi:uracil-DNA glycosylase